MRDFIMAAVPLVVVGIALAVFFTGRAGKKKKQETIEILQLFGGRYAEIDDFLINTFGTLAGYLFYTCLRNFRENRKKAVCSFIALAVSLGICFSGIYFVGDHSEQLPEGFFCCPR